MKTQAQHSWIRLCLDESIYTDVLEPLSRYSASSLRDACPLGFKCNLFMLNNGPRFCSPQWGLSASVTQRQGLKIQTDWPHSMVSPAAPPVSNLKFHPRTSTPDIRRNQLSQNSGSNQEASCGTGSKIPDNGESVLLSFLSFSVWTCLFLNTPTPVSASLSVIINSSWHVPRTSSVWGPVLELVYVFIHVSLQPADEIDTIFFFCR